MPLLAAMHVTHCGGERRQRSNGGKGEVSSFSLSTLLKIERSSHRYLSRQSRKNFPTTYFLWVLMIITLPKTLSCAFSFIHRVDS